MEVMEEDDNELYQKHFSQYLEHEVTNENMEETWQKVLHFPCACARLSQSTCNFTQNI